MNLQTPTRNQKPETRNRSAAFTLIEIMVVIAVMGLIAIVVYPSFGSLSVSRLKLEARRLQSEVQLTYNLATMEKANYRLAFDLESQCYRAERKQGDVYEAAKNELLLEHCLPDSVWIEELEILDRKLTRTGNEYIYFSPFGYSEPARIYVTNDATDSRSGYTLFTQPATGSVKVYEGLVSYKDLEDMQKHE